MAFQFAGSASERFIDICQIAQRRRLRASHRRSDCGLTTLELLVSIGVIGLLAAILLPAVQSTRAKSHQVACLNNLRQLAHATNALLSVTGKYPRSVHVYPEDYVGPRDRSSVHAQLLPYLDQQTTWDRLDLFEDHTQREPPTSARQRVRPLTPDPRVRLSGGRRSRRREQLPGLPRNDDRHPRHMVDAGTAHAWPAGTGGPVGNLARRGEHRRRFWTDCLTPPCSANGWWGTATRSDTTRGPMSPRPILTTTFPTTPS